MYIFFHICVDAEGNNICDIGPIKFQRLMTLRLTSSNFKLLQGYYILIDTIIICIRIILTDMST